MTRHTQVGVDLGLTDQEKKYLHNIARSVIESRTTGKSQPVCEAPTPTLQEKRGAFVSLHSKGQLRGCIGYIHAIKPLYQTIQDMAIAAAFQDPRFPPLQKDELSELDIELSVLTPMREIADITEIEVGTHGLMIVLGNYSGLLLPQVATEYGWSREEFLDHTCMKAGLPTAAWKDKNAKIFLFSADVF
jgi:AmmeMemoRadiSam system protein A